jgi:hypothetical protein
MIRSTLVGISIVLCLAVSSCAPPAENVDDIIASNKALDAKYVGSYMKNNLDSLMSTYLNSPNTFEIESDGTLLKGYDAINTYYQNFFSGFEVLDGKILEQDYNVYEGAVIGHGKYWVKFRPRGGPELEITGRFFDVREKHNGKWYYVANSMVGVQPPSQPMSPAAEMKGKKE